MSKCTLTPKQIAIANEYGHLFFFAGKDPVKTAQRPYMVDDSLSVTQSACAQCQILLIEKLIDEGLLKNPKENA